MQIVRIAPIVEGDGEVIAVPLLLRRIASELLGDAVFDVMRPWRLKRGYVLPAHPNKLCEALNVSALNLLRHPAPAPKSIILVLMDRDPSQEPTCILGPKLYEETQKYAHPDVKFSCVLADTEFESWFVASASSLKDYLEFDEVRWNESASSIQTKGKTWIKKHFKGGNYRETVDQVKLAARMNLHVCRQNAPSFDKLCRELESAT